MPFLILCAVRLMWARVARGQLFVEIRMLKRSFEFVHFHSKHRRVMRSAVWCCINNGNCCPGKGKSDKKHAKHSNKLSCKIPEATQTTPMPTEQTVISVWAPTEDHVQFRFFGFKWQNSRPVFLLIRIQQQVNWDEDTNNVTARARARVCDRR